jgi:hypothetical protein
MRTCSNRQFKILTAILTGKNPPNFFSVFSIFSRSYLLLYFFAFIRLLGKWRHLNFCTVRCLPIRKGEILPYFLKGFCAISLGLRTVEFSTFKPGVLTKIQNELLEQNLKKILRENFAGIFRLIIETYNV